MTRRTLKNVSDSVHQRLLNKARESGRPFNEVLQYFAMERFLYRLSRTPPRTVPLKRAQPRERLRIIAHYGVRYPGSGEGAAVARDSFSSITPAAKTAAVPKVSFRDLFTSSAFFVSPNASKHFFFNTN